VRRGLALSVVGALALWPATATAGDAQMYELGKAQFDKGLYADAERTFKAMLEGDHPTCPMDSAVPASPCRLTVPSTIERARELVAAALIAQKRPKESHPYIRKILKAKKDYVPDKDQLPQELIAEIAIVKALPEDGPPAGPDPAYVKALEKQAQEQWIEAHRWIALVPFGVGQFQNGNETLGAIFAVTETLTATASIFLAVSANAIAPRPSNTATAAIKETQFQLQVANQIVFGTFAALAIGGIVQAQVAFVPKRLSPTKRPLPKVTVLPTIAPVPGGASAGVIGSF